MLRLAAISMVALGAAGPCAADEADLLKAKPPEAPKEVKCEEIADGAKRAQCIIDRNTTPGGGVRAYQPPGVLAKPDPM